MVSQRVATAARGLFERASGASVFGIGRGYRRRAGTSEGGTLAASLARMPTADGFARVRAHLQRGARWDGAFDWLLPPLARTKGRRYWSPLSVARRAALRFTEFGVRRVLDVGAGPGKFCIAAALARPDLALCGIEQRHALVKTAQELAAGLRLTNVEFRVGDALMVPWRGFDGLFFFNPFGENVFATEDTFDSGVELSERRLAAELLGTFRKLSSLRLGSVAVTYCGLGGPIPSSYDLVREEPVGSAALRTWVKRRSYEAEWLHLDQQDEVSMLPRPSVEQILERMATGTDLPP
jgi:SAM-dependent methyltransferase